MARMYPARIRDATQSQAERRLYDAFYTGLSNDYVVFHSVAWLARDPRSGAQDGEADFIVVHPTRGMLVIEVKGGRILYDGSLGQWYSGQNAIKDPFEQARRNKHSLLAKLNDLPYWRNRWITLGHAVAFPDAVVKQDLRLDAPQVIVLDASDLAHVRDWVESVLAYWQTQVAQEGAPGQTGVEELIRLLSPSWDLHAPLAAEFVDEQHAIIRLTEDQFNVLDILSERRRVAIHGCAGSGKTTLAIEQAKRLGRQVFRVLLTCYNRHLAEYIRSDETLPKTVEVLHFHGLCAKLANEAKLSDRLNQGRNTQTWYDRTLPDLLMEAVDTLGPQYDAIVVDEGQDFKTDWWVPLQYLLPDPDHSILYVFYDDNQNIYQAASDLPTGLENFPLRTNCRNTQLIHRAFLPFYRSTLKPSARGPKGRPPEVQYYTSEQTLKQALDSTLLRLIMHERIDPGDVVILTPRSRKTSCLWQWDSLGGFRLTDHWPPGSGEIYCTSVYQFKGLESPVIILAEANASTQQDMETILYVGCSRARNHLIVLADASLPQTIQRKLGQTAAS